MVCYKHCQGFIVDPLTKKGQQVACPICVAENQAGRDRERAIAEAEAARRNSEIKPPITFDQALAECRAQGFQDGAAEALATRRVSQERAEAAPTWTVDQVLVERIEAERQRRMDAGTLTTCPVCREFVYVSQGVILSHYRVEYDPEGEKGGTEVTCEGTGQVLAK
jgi:hypothetical protein